MLTVKIELKETTQPIERNDVVNCYQKGDFFIIFRETKDKKFSEYYPMANIWRVTKDY